MLFVNRILLTLNSTFVCRNKNPFSIFFLISISMDGMKEEKNKFVFIACQYGEMIMCEMEID